MADLSLFPVINPNIEEIIEREQALDGENVILETEEPIGHNEIFSNKKNVKLSVSQPKKDKYPHLAEARKKGAITRQKKAEAKRILKAEAKAIKDEEKRLRREATQERNRVKARERYRKQKAEKDEQQDIKESIRLRSQAKKDEAERIERQSYRRPQHKPIQQPKHPGGGMDFEKFAGYMMRYEGLKREYETSRSQKIPVQVAPPPPKEFPDNYPLAHIYQKNKNRKMNFNNF
tara:strand:+ start:4861 stop:5559 length:699 start_codon:yes stop_codon:yes gene_type:complete